MLLLGTGLFLSLRCGFPQLRLRRVLRGTLGTLRRGGAGEPAPGFSPFQALSTALAGTVGTGNIAGVAGAILLGGPGAVFWMWAAALLGMGTKYAEIALAVRFRVFDEEGRPQGGPMYYIERGLGPRFRPLAAAFALAGGLASFGIGSLVQSGEIAASAQLLFGLGPLAAGLATAALTAAVLLGGLKRIGRFTAALVPLMAGLYLLICLPVLILHAAELPGVFLLILRSAFGLRAIGGGLAGWTMRESLRQGLARGLFSNEAGLGSAPMAHAAAACRSPRDQALWGVLEVLIDSFVICSLTAFVVLLSGIWRSGHAGGFSSPGGAAAEAFRLLLPGPLGGKAVSLCLLFFALSSIIGWGCYGEICWSWLLRGRKEARLAFRLLFSLACLIGALGPGDRIWAAADTLNGLMAFPNLLALLLLSNTAAALSRG